MLSAVVQEVSSQTVLDYLLGICSWREGLEAAFGPTAEGIPGGYLNISAPSLYDVNTKCFPATPTVSTFQ